MHHSGREDNEMIRRMFPPGPPIEASRKAAMDELMAKAAKTQALGATGEFPEGKLTDADEGEIKISVGVSGGKVIVNFGSPVSWLGLTAQQARQLAESLRQKSYQL